MAALRAAPARHWIRDRSNIIWETWDMTDKNLKNGNLGHDQSNLGQDMTKIEWLLNLNMAAKIQFWSCPIENYHRLPKNYYLTNENNHRLPKITIGYLTQLQLPSVPKNYQKYTIG